MSEQKAAVIRPEFGGGFSRRAVVWIAVIGATSFAIAIILAVFGQDLGRKPSASSDTFSYSLIGHRAFVEYVESLGVGVLVRQTRAGIGTGPNVPLFVISPSPQWLEDDETRRLEALQAEAARRSAAFVLVLPKWEATPSKSDKGWISGLSRMSTGTVEGVLSKVDDSTISSLLIRHAGSGESAAITCTSQWGATERLSIETAPSQYLRSTSALEAVVKCPAGILIGRRVLTDGTEMFIVSDPDVLNNQGLARADHANLMTSLVTRWLQADGIVVDETVHGYRRQAGLLYELFRFPLLLAVLQSVLLIGVVLWAGMTRFGKPLPLDAGIEAEGKEVLVDNTAKLLAYGGHSTDGLLNYFNQTVRAVAAHYFLPPDLPENELLSQLQKIAKGRGVEIDLSTMKARVIRLTTTLADERAVKLARHLHQWRLTMMQRQDASESKEQSS